MNLTIRLLQEDDIQPIANAFAAIGWNKPASQYARYLEEQGAGYRSVLVAFDYDVFAGYVTVCWQSKYAPLRNDSIPEIQDFNVLPEYRRRGIGTRLMDEAEKLAAEQSPVVKIGVGLYSDYGAAQRMYVKRGYVPDGKGVTYGERFVKPGESVPVDDDLVLHFTKRVR